MVKVFALNANARNRCIEKCNGNKYLTLIPTDKSKDTLKKYEELWNKIRDLIRSITNNLDSWIVFWLSLTVLSDVKLDIFVLSSCNNHFDSEFIFMCFQHLLKTVDFILFISRQKNTSFSEAITRHSPVNVYIFLFFNFGFISWLFFYIASYFFIIWLYVCVHVCNIYL